MKKTFLLFLVVILMGAGCTANIDSPKDISHEAEEMVQEEKVVQTHVDKEAGWSVNFPSDWKFGINGNPDPAYEYTTYFYREDAPRILGFDFTMVSVTLFNAKENVLNGATTSSYQEHVNRPGAIVGEVNGLFYVINYTENNLSEVTKDGFKLISESFTVIDR